MELASNDRFSKDDDDDNYLEWQVEDDEHDELRAAMRHRLIALWRGSNEMAYKCRKDETQVPL